LTAITADRKFQRQTGFSEGEFSDPRQRKKPLGFGQPAKSIIAAVLKVSLYDNRTR